MSVSLIHPNRTHQDAYGNPLVYAGTLVGMLWSSAELLAWRGEQLIGNTWHDMPAPEAGESCHAGTFGMVPVVDDRRATYAAPLSQATHVAVPMTQWGDYTGSDVARSNARTLVRDYPDTFITVNYDYSTEQLALALDQLVPESLLEELAALAHDYPLRDDDDHSALQLELWAEMWDAYVESDLRRELVTRFQDVGNDIAGRLNNDVTMTSDRLHQLFDQACEEAGAYPFCEDAVSATLERHDWDRVVALVHQAVMALPAV